GSGLALDPLGRDLFDATPAAVPEHGQLRLPQRLGAADDLLWVPPGAVEVRHQVLGGAVVDLPQGRDARPRPRPSQGALETDQALASGLLAKACLTGAEHGQFALAQVHLGDLQGAEDAVLLARLGLPVAACQDDAGEQERVPAADTLPAKEPRGLAPAAGVQ